MVPSVLGLRLSYRQKTEGQKTEDRKQKTENRVEQERR